MSYFYDKRLNRIKFWPLEHRYLYEEIFGAVVMYFLLFDDRTKQYYHEFDGWVDHIVLASFFNYLSQAEEVIIKKNVGHLIILTEVEDHSKIDIRKIVKNLKEL